MSNTWIQTTTEGREWKRKYDRDHYAAQKDVRSARSAARRRNKRAWLLVDSARRRSAESNIPFNLDGYQSDIQARIDAGFCELSGIPFNLDGGRTFDSPSLDRITPSVGYLYSNLRIVCTAMNLALGDWGEDALLTVLQSWQNKLKVKT